MIIAGVKRREEIIKIWWVAVFLDFYIRFLVLGLKSPGALTLGLTCRAFLFSIFFYWFIMWQTGEKKQKELLSGTANLTGGAGIKNTQGMNEDMKWSG